MGPSSYIGAKDCGKPSFDAFCRHGRISFWFVRAYMAKASTATTERTRNEPRKQQNLNMLYFLLSSGTPWASVVVPRFSFSFDRTGRSLGFAGAHSDNHAVLSEVYMPQCGLMSRSKVSTHQHCLDRIHIVVFLFDSALQFGYTSPSGILHS